MKKRWKNLLRMALPVLAVAVVLLFFSTALDELGSGQAQEQLKQVEEAVRRSSVACYAAEGVYPPSLEALQERFGLQIDETHCTVHYVAIAQNLMPDITVVPVQGTGS
ncbi:MAG: hypothetical protein HFF00_03385 [Ruminiclostridium sp.]|jgi:hypothetical protein|nr:hypothetical protein [Ruminiclostridium sp.]